MDKSARIDELLDLWEESLENGQEILLEELCRNAPELLEPLKLKIAALEHMSRCFEAIEKPALPSANRGTAPKSIDYQSKLLDLAMHDRGGLGVVYRAKDEDLHRDVAVKFLNLNVARKEEYRLRFQQEAEITGRLDHPGVVPVYACGESKEKQPFYVMRFIRGDTYDDAIKSYHNSRSTRTFAQRQLARQKLLVQLASVCQTIAYAHTRGIVHRDIKPKNIMLGKYGETLVVDWGLAIPFQRDGEFRVLDEKTLVPQSPTDSQGREGEGTPVFMSPEQAAGKEDLGPASDIYSLGVVLYRVLTGKFAFNADSPMLIKTAIMKGDFVPPRLLDKSIPTPLEAICLKAMSLLPKERYKTASDMAADIENFLADVPVGAHPYSLTEKVSRFVHRHLPLFFALLVTACGLLIASSIASISYYKESRRTSQSLEVARQSQVENLNMFCRMSAKSISLDLQARLHAMQELASSGELVELVSKAEGADMKLALNDLLSETRNSINKRFSTDSILLLGFQGKLLGATSTQNIAGVWETIEHWKYPYFHGGDLVLDSPNSERNKPLQQISLSPAFVPDRINRLLCSLSVPVVSSDGNDVLAVLVMNIQMGKFEPLMEYEADSVSTLNKFPVLVETRGSLSGAMLHHPDMSDDPGKSAVDRLDGSILAQVTKIGCTEAEPQIITDYLDPYQRTSETGWNSVALPIQIRFNDEDSVACGWYLLVQLQPMNIATGR